MLRSGGEPELERGAQLVVRLVGAVVRRTAWSGHCRQSGQPGQPAQLARSADARRELIARERSQDCQERRRKEGEDRVLQGSRRARGGRRSRRLGELQLLAGRGSAHGQLAQALLDRANLGGRVGPAARLVERLEQVAAPLVEQALLAALLHREEAVGDGVGDRRCAVGVAVAPDHVEDVRVAIHCGLNLVLQCVGGLAGKPLRGPLEDITGPEERLQRREAPLHSLGITRLEDARGVRLHDLGRRAVGLREGERNDQDRQRQRDDDERNQPGAAPERVQMTREVDRLITVVGAPGASPERVDGLGHAIDDRTDPQSTRVLLVSSFVVPHVGGVEQFVETARGILLDRGYDVRILACRLAGADTTADDTVPTRFLGGSSWPLPVGGWRTVWQGVRQADVVVANNGRHLLPVLTVLLARVQRKGAIFVVHGSGEGPQTGSAAFRVVRAAFQRTLARRAIRVSRAVSVSRVGVVSIRRLYGAEAGYLPYPLRAGPPVARSRALAADEPVRVVWVGRLSPEKIRSWLCAPSSG